MTGGWAGHSLAVEVHLRPVLVELGATVPARGLYVTEPELTDLDTAITGWAAIAGPLIRGVLVFQLNPDSLIFVGTVRGSASAMAASLIAWSSRRRECEQQY